MSRRGQYILWLSGVAVLAAAVFAPALIWHVPAGGTAGTLLIALYWLWNGILLMANVHPEWNNWDRWERQAYGLAFVVGGALWSVFAWLSWTNLWIYLLAGLAIPILVAAVGRCWYVELKRSDDYHKNQTEKD